MTMQLSICTDAVFHDRDFDAALEALAPTPLRTIEFWSHSRRDMARARRAVREEGFSIRCFCTEGGSLVDPDGHADWLAGLETALALAVVLDTPYLISQTGQDTGAPREAQFMAMQRCLIQALPALERSGVCLLVEPLNLRVDHRGYFLSNSDEAKSLIEAIDSPYVRMLFDIYHQQITEGDVLRRLIPLLPLVGHLHFAGNPGRHEPWLSELDSLAIVAALKAAGYEGALGLEYVPTEADPVPGLVAFAERCADTSEGGRLLDYLS